MCQPEVNEADQRYDAIGEWNRAGQVLIEHGVHHAPDETRKHEQHGAHDQQRLSQPKVGFIERVSADASNTGNDRLHP